MRNHLLKELVKLISPDRMDNIQMIGLQQDKVEELYNGMLGGQFDTRNDAIQHFFEGQYSNIYYCNLEKKLQERLINTLLCIESRKTNTSVQKAYFLCNKNLAAIQILRGEGKRKLAVPIAENTLKTALKYELSEIILSLAKMLQYHYSVIEGKYKKFQFYSKIVKKWGEILQAEERIQTYFCEIAFHASKSKSPNLEKINGMNQELDELMFIAKKHGTFRLNLFAYNVRKYQLVYNHEGVINTCTEAINFFDTLKYQPPYTAKFSFLYKTVPAYIHLGQFEEANKTIVKCLELVPRGTHNWSIILQYRLILAFHSENYNMAFEVVKNVKQNGHQLYENIKEQWKIYEAYCYFFIEMGKIEYVGKPFRVGRFIN